MGRQQRLGGQLGQDVRDVGHAGVLTTGRTQVVHQVLVGLSDGLGGFRLQHATEASDVALGHLRVGVFLEVPLLHQVRPQRVLVVQLQPQHAPHDSAHVTRAGVVERDAQGLERIDGLLVGSDLVDLHLAGAPESVHGRADGAPALVDGQLVRLEGLALGGEDQLHALGHRRDLLASDRSDHQPVRTARVALAIPAASSSLALLAEQGDEATVNGGVTAGGELEHGSAVQVVGHGLHDLAVLRVGVVLHPAPRHDLVPEVDGAVTTCSTGHGLVDRVAVSIVAPPPGPGVDVVDQVAEHAVHATEDGLAVLDLDLAVGKDALPTITDHQGQHRCLDALLRLLGIRHHGVATHPEVQVLGHDHLGRSVFALFVAAALLCDGHGLVAGVHELAAPVHADEERSVGVVRVAQDQALDQGDAVGIRALLLLGLRLVVLALDHLAVAVLLLHDLEGREHASEDAFDGVAGQSPRSLRESQRDQGAGLSGCGVCTHGALLCRERVMAIWPGFSTFHQDGGPSLRWVAQCQGRRLATIFPIVNVFWLKLVMVNTFSKTGCFLCQSGLTMR